MAQFTSKAQDTATSKGSVVALAGSQVTAKEQILLADIFEGATLDETHRWTKTTASGGTVSQTSAGGCVIAPSTSSTGSAILQSNDVIPYLAGSEVSFRTCIRAGTVGIASNTREIGLRVDGNNYIQFRMEGTDWICRVQSGGSAFQSDMPISTVRADDMLPMELEIRVSRSPDEVHFICTTDSGQTELAHYEQRKSTTRLFQSALAQAYFRSLNAGSTVDNTLIINSILVTQRWNADGQNIKTKKMTADGIVCRGPVLYYGMSRAASTGGAAIMYDNTSAAGTIVDQYDASGVRSEPWPSPRFCYNGLYLDLTTDAVIVAYLPV